MEAGAGWGLGGGGGGGQSRIIIASRGIMNGLLFISSLCPHLFASTARRRERLSKTKHGTERDEGAICGADEGERDEGTKKIA